MFIGSRGKTEFHFPQTWTEFKTQISLPSDSKDDEFAYYHFESNLSSPSPNRIRVSPFPSVREKEPNNSYKLATVTELTLPLAFDGIISISALH